MLGHGGDWIGWAWASTNWALRLVVCSVLVRIRTWPPLSLNTIMSVVPQSHTGARQQSVNYPAPNNEYDHSAQPQARNSTRSSTRGSERREGSTRSGTGVCCINYCRVKLLTRSAARTRRANRRYPTPCRHKAAPRVPHSVE